jgi:hypothetical protein
MTEETKQSSFAVAINPDFKEDGTWDGSVTAHIEEDVKGDLTPEELTQIRSVCGMLAACLPLMEQDPDFLEHVKEFFYSSYQGLLDEIYAEEDEATKPNFTKDGNVISLDFSTKTHGSA